MKRLAHPCESGNLMVLLGGVTGRCMQPTAIGAKSWILRMPIGGRRRDIGPFGFPTVTLAQARDTARKAGDKGQGGDPVKKRKAA